MIALIVFPVILICLFLQAFFAGAEMAVISCNRIKVRHRAEIGNRKARIVQAFIEEPRNLLSTTLVGYNVMVVAGSCVLNNFIARYVPHHIENIVSLAVYLPLVLIIGQIVPMAYGRLHANKLCLLCAPALRLSYHALFPLVWLASLLGRGITALMGKRSKKNPFVTREELELILKESHEAGVLRKEEKKMIEEIFHFGETSARNVMVPLINVVAAPETATAGELRRIVIETAHSRIPIYRERIDRIVGTVQATDLVGTPDDLPAKSLAIPPYIVPESISIELVFGELQRNRAHMAIVVDEHGGVSGVITIEDIVEEIVGEIGNEYDTGEASPWKKEAKSIIVDGGMRIEDFNEQFGQRIPEEDAETIGGFVTHLLCRIPEQGDEFKYEQLRFRVLEATDRLVAKIEVMGAG